MEVLELDAAATADALPQLAAIMRACVEGGASVNFVLPFTQAESEGWWRRVVLAGVQAGERHVLAAKVGGRILGTVQLVPAMQPNQAHRADVAKLLVHPEGRRRGIARTLMTRLEDVARARGRHLLTLDTSAGGAAERLYRALGYVMLGTVPRFAMAADGSGLEGASFFWKDLAPA